MLIYSYNSKNWEKNNGDLYRGIVRINHDYIEFGYFNINENCVPIAIRRHGNTLLINKECCSIPLYYNNPSGQYVLNKVDKNNRTDHPSRDIFPYPIRRCYNFSKHEIIPVKQKLFIDKDYLSIRNYTFGFEFETCSGNAPWILLRECNLVPLYDGSIKGHEYVTFPLNVLQLPNLKTYLSVIYDHCKYDKDCSLHIHYGGFPIDFKSIQHLMDCWDKFQFDLLNYIPPYSYCVELYKSNNKSYNKPLTGFRLKMFYRLSTGNCFENDDSFYLPNLFDDTEDHKWQVRGRYYNMNIMHLISGSKYKTVEFRFLRPTKNYEELKWFILILGGFLNYSKDLSTDPSECTVKNIINKFPEETSRKLLLQSKFFYRLHKIQCNCDKPGINDKLKEMVLNNFMD